MKKKKVVIGSGIAATATVAALGAATWIIGGMVYDGTVGKKPSVKAEDMKAGINIIKEGIKAYNAR